MNWKTAVLVVLLLTSLAAPALNVHRGGVLPTEGGQTSQRVASVPSSGSIVDSSGNGWDGTVNGNPVHINDTIALDGVDDFLVLSSGSWQSSTVAVEFSLKLDSLPANVGYPRAAGMRSWDSGGTPQAGMFLGIYGNGSIGCLLGDGTNGGSTNSPIIWHEENAQAGLWYTLGCSWNGSHMKMEVNGSSVGTVAGNSYWSSNSMSWASRDVYLGKHYYMSGSYTYTDGQFDNFRMWSSEIRVGSEIVNWTMDVQKGTWIDQLEFESNGGWEGAEHSETDAEGNVYVHGDYSGTLTLGSHSVTSSGNTDIYVAKLNKSGTWDWLFSGGGSGSDRAYGSLQLDGIGNVYATGFFTSGGTFGGTFLNDSAGVENLYLVKLNTSTGTMEWAQTAYGCIEAFDIAFAPNHDPILTGMHQWTTTKYFGNHTIQGQGSWDGFAARIGATNKTWMWATNAGANGYEAFGGGQVINGQLVATGRMGSSITLGSTSLSSNGGTDWMVAGINITDGSYLWADSIGGSGTEFNIGREPVIPDGQGGAFLIGWSNGAITVGSTSISNSGGNDAVLVHVDVANGTADSIESFGGSGEDYYHGATLDSAGNLLLTGKYTGSPSLAGTSLPSATCGIFVTSRAPNGTYEWATGGVGNTDGCRGTTIDLVNDSVAVVGGNFKGTMALGDLSTMSTSGSNHALMLAWIRIGDRPFVDRAAPDLDGDGIPDVDDLDIDGDQVDNTNDSFPRDPNEWNDTDSDGVGDNSDPNIDGDIADNDDDAFPWDPNEWNDTDSDGVGDNADPNIDGDIADNDEDAFPWDPNEWNDTDSDGIGDNADPNIDGDMADNNDDAFPWDPNEWNDTDSDGVGDNADLDDDADTRNDSDDAFPRDPNEWDDTDGDGIGNNADTDDDGDGWDDVDDEFPLDPNEWNDTDGDGVGDNADVDSDGDNWNDGDDAFPLDPNEWNDTDGDGTGDNSDLDDDGDSWNDDDDEFPWDPNEWNDTDGDGTGDNADLDDDNDGWNDSDDDLPHDPSEWRDLDGDGIGDNADTDDDGDGVDDVDDLCPNSWPGVPVTTDGCAIEGDFDQDGVINAIDVCPSLVGPATGQAPGCPDRDGDGWPDPENGFETAPFGDGDAFPDEPSQWSDLDNDSCGDNPDGVSPDKFPSDPTECHDTDNDGVGDNFDLFNLDPNQWADEDGDGIGDNTDVPGGDVFPQDPTEWFDTDGDGVGDNSDAFPSEATQWNDSDGDEYGDNPLGLNPDAFPDEGSQWSDADGDGYGDNPFGLNPDAFPNEATQWKDSDGDGYGDNQSGVNPDAFPYDPTEWLDSDGDGVGDGADAFPFDATRWLPREENTLFSRWFDTNSDDGYAGFIQQPAVVTVGISAILLSVLTLLQTNLVAQFLPEALRFGSMARKRFKQDAEAEAELNTLMAICEFYADDLEGLRGQVREFRTDMMSKSVSNHISEEGRDQLDAVVENLLRLDDAALATIWTNRAFFGLEGNETAEERRATLELEMEWRDVEAAAAPSTPPATAEGWVEKDGYQFLQWPPTSDGDYWYRRAEGDPWVKHWVSNKP